MTDLEKILKGIADQTGVNVAVHEDDGASGSLSDVWQSEEKTFFRFMYGSRCYVGEITGNGRIESNYAFLIAALIENSAIQEANLTRGEYLRGILLGDYSAAKIQKYTIKYGVPDSPCFAVALRVEKRMEETLAHLAQCSTNSADTVVQMDDNSCVFLKFVDDSSDYQSAFDYAAFLEHSLYEEIGVQAVVGVGTTVKNLYDVNVSYQQAATTVRMCELFGSKVKVHTYKEYILIKMLEDLPEQRLGEYMRELLDDEALEVFEDEDMVGTAEEFLQSSLNVSETSRNLYMHRNTLMYRLDKIERCTGLNIRKFSDAVSFRVLTILYKLIRK